MSGYKGHNKVGLIFSGGPAPSANAVISSVCLSFIDKSIPIFGFYYGFEFLEKFDSNNPASFKEGIQYSVLKADIARIRNRRGVFLKTSRANPGKDIHNRQDLEDPIKNRKLMNILDAFDHLGIGFLVTIGGDDTLKTANYLGLMGLPVIHIPKTIDNDYFGISWTFGYWSAVEVCKETLLNLRADSESTNSYFLVELMGRKAGWLTYAAGISGEAAIMISTEDVEEKILDIDKLADHIVDIILTREKHHKSYGVICVAESLAEKLPEDLKPKERDKHGNYIMGSAEVGRIIRDAAMAKYLERTGNKKKIVYKQLGYETRSTLPIGFDVVLGSMLGFGAYKLFKKGEFNCMVSVSDNFQVQAVPFDKLIDPDTLLTRLRDVPKGSDFFELKEALSFKRK